MGVRLISHQGSVGQFEGTCGLVACANICRLSGLDITEEEIVHKAIKLEKCTTGRTPSHNGATNADERQFMLHQYGIESKCIPQDAEIAAKYLEEGKGVIVSVDIDYLRTGKKGKVSHAVTLTGTKRDQNGNLMGLYMCDSLNAPSFYYSKEELGESFTSTKMNVTSKAIRNRF